MNDKLFEYPTSNINFASPKFSSQNQYAFPNKSLTSHPIAWNSSQNPNPNHPATTTYTPSQYLPQFNFPSSSSIQTTSNINLSTANVTRSSTSYVVPSSLGSGFDYEKYLANKGNEKDKMSTVWDSTVQTDGCVQRSADKLYPYSENFRQYLTSADPSA